MIPSRAPSALPVSLRKERMMAFVLIALRVLNPQPKAPQVRQRVQFAIAKYSETTI
tara:strand:- start:432 stop:599 length:168 start_codon:yes stop_codon:yes gene_type:complete